MAKISCVILDLDNTLYDWFHVWYSSFKPFLETLSKQSDIDEQILKNEFQKIHRMYGTSEYAFRLEKSEILKEKFPTEDLKEKFSEAILQEKFGRDSSLSLYPSVLETLWDLKSKGIKLVAYTDSMEFYISMRLKRLGLDGLLDIVYTTEDHGIPESIDLAEYRSKPDEYYKLSVTKHRAIPAGQTKPNPDLLLKIVSDLNLEKEDCIYIGDSLDRDIQMAQEAGITDVWAVYGKEMLKRNIIF